MTKKLISDSVLYKLAGGIPHPSFPVHERDIWSAIDNRINSIFKLRHLDTTMPGGETLPEAAMIATYENIAVTSFNEKSKSTLPITPISLMKDLGIYMVYDPKNPDVPFIPVRRGYTAILRTDQLMNDLFGLISYEPKNSQIIYNKDITTFGITEVTMELCVFDVSEYGVTDELPIPADYQTQLEDELMQEFAPVLSKSGFVNNFTNPTQQPVK